MQHFVLTYHYVSDYMQQRDAFRAEHLARIAKLVKESKILAAGVTPEEPGAVLIFFTDAEDEVRRFAEGDPYFMNGLIASYEVNRWLLGDGIDAILHPGQK